jgi:two-component system chemotaxis response regulator CheY
MAKILIVDDSDTLRMQLKDILESEGHEVIEGVHGVDGLEKATQNPDIRLLISDYNMPEMDGVVMCRKVRELESLKNIPMFMLTTESTSELKALGKEAGIMAWIVKPFNEEKLRVVVQKILSRT